VAVIIVYNTSMALACTRKHHDFMRFGCPCQSGDVLSVLVVTMTSNLSRFGSLKFEWNSFDSGDRAKKMDVQ